MGLVNYDPDGTPEVTREMAVFAQENNLHLVHVICDQRDAKPGDPVGGSFMAVTPFCPQRGDRIGLQNGVMCEVQKVYYKVSVVNGMTALVPNVLAYLIDGSETDRRSTRQ